MTISTLSLLAQAPQSFDSVNTQSYTLYEKGSWKEMIAYGKKSLAGGQDFTLLRLRLGYAAFMLNNFSEAAKHYEAVLKHDSYNSTARYYLWLCRKYLGQSELADVHAKFLSNETTSAEHLHAIDFTEAGIETSFKNTNILRRGNTLYARLDIGTRLGWHIHMRHSGAILNQTIGDSAFTFVTHNNKIDISQKEYYNTTTISLNEDWQLKAAYHYLKTPFNNFSYSNHAGMFGVKYNDYYFDLQADAIIARLTDSACQQYDLTLGIYPEGNLNLYSFSTAMLRNRLGKSGFNFKEVIGFKLLKNLWVEGNGTFGSFSNLFENDALYVYNAVDRNLVKAGATAYVTLSAKCLVQAGYTFEQRELYHSLKTFYQHSITGGLSCKF